MMISTRGRYALRVMIDLAEHQENGRYTAMKAVAERQGVSLKYMEKILPLLVSARMVEGITGKGGGYRLTREPQEYRVGEILRLTEGDLAPVACVACDAEPCPHTGECRTRPMWGELSKRINDYLDSVTLADMMQKSEDI
ncbi:MAG: Rrf2 family transcriptional regulator [Oscillospiraceae bacterium]|nr:Rrf2 family transcriptional regulator [Oscillospiraceae bacterium]